MTTTRRLDILPAWDRTTDDPKTNQGVHGVEMRWHVIGPKRAVYFLLLTNWMRADVAVDFGPRAGAYPGPIPAQIGYHSPIPMCGGEKPREQHCEFTGGLCYADASYAIAC